MDGASFWFWVVLAGAAYVFMPSFRREVNSWIVKLAGKVKDDTTESAKAQETHLFEDVGFEMFKGDHPNDARIAGGWHKLPMDLRKQYITRAVESLIPPENKAAS